MVSELLGSGGMAEVYAGIHPDLGRKVAIKVILPQFAAESNFEERFRREARVVASLRHAHIVQLYDFDAVNGRHFMVMEYLDGGTLKDHLRALRQRKSRMPLLEIARLIVAIADALDYAHGRGAIHRDIKPANILFTAEREPILTDFGIAKLLEDVAQLTATGGVVGSPFYMSPEQADGGEVDARSDQYSLGVVLYEMATGRVPFQGSTAVAVMTQHLNSAPPSPRTVNAELSVGVEAVLLKVLGKHPDDRFSCTGELAQAFHQAVEEQSSMAIPVLRMDDNAPTVLGRAGASPDNLINPTVGSVGEEATAASADSQVSLPGEDAPTVIGEREEAASPPPLQPVLTPAPHAESPQEDRSPPEVVDQPPTPPDQAFLPAVDERHPSEDRRPPPVPSAAPPQPAMPNFNVSGIQAGIVNLGGEQSFSGNLTFNFDSGDSKDIPPQQEASGKVAGLGSGDDSELAAHLEALRRTFAGSARVDRFVRLVTQFRAQLEAVPVERADDRKQVVKRVQALLMEMTEAKPDPDMVEIMGTSLERAVQPLSGVDPDLPTMATRITSWVELMVQPE